MTSPAARLLLAASLTLAAAAPPIDARPQDRPVHLLDVPFLPQSEALCGGAAVAMVMRYWGATGVYAETFSPLVDRDAGGIHGTDLLAALRARGWDARSFRGDAALVQQQLAARRPVIALIEDRPGRYHYVVIVGWADTRVILHDPARAPFRIIPADRFIRAWEPTGFWTMVATKDVNADVTRDVPTARRSGDDGACHDAVDEGIRLASTGEIEDARRLFELAQASCPLSPSPWREMAGLHALRSEWREAAADARQALARDSRDEQAARILATALFLEGDENGALSAWNAIGEPRLDIVNIRGLERTRYAIAAATTRLEPGEVLTPRALELARRRLDELPAAQVTHVEYKPGEEGLAQVDAVVIERPVAPTSLPAAAAIGARVVTDRELAFTFSSPTGGGETWRASWRWWEHRPRVLLRLDAPAPFGGTWGVEGSVERQTYQTGGSTSEEARRTAMVRVADWTPSALHWEVSAGVDAFGGLTRSVMAAAQLEQRLYDDRLSLRVAGAAWHINGGTATASARGEWQSRRAREGSTWLARGGLALASSNAPLALWQGAGTGQGRDLLLRAHPLLDDGIVRGAVFGRRVLDGGVEWRMWRTTGRRLLRIAPAIFVDTARAFDGLPDSNTRWQLDAGGGLRLAVPGSGVLRVDLARGIREGGFVLSAGWTR